MHDSGLYWLKYNHGKSQDFGYILKDDPDKELHWLCSFLDTIGYMDCQSQWMAIQAEYHRVVAENNGTNLINEGLWDGNLIRLAENTKLLYEIQWYCSIVAKKEFQIVPLKVNNLLQFVGLDNREIVEIGQDFNITGRRSLTITSGEKYFKNEFLIDQATGKVYGLFTNDGMNYLGLYDPKEGTVGMGQKATKRIYPRVFKVYGGYAYSVFFDSGSNRGVISRVKIE